MGIDVINDWKYFYRCIRILKYTNYKTTKKEIVKVTNDTINNINLLNLLKFLKSNGFLKVDESRIPYVYYINKTKLANYLYPSHFYSEINILNEITNKLHSY